MSKNIPLIVAGVIFIIIAVLHLLRLILQVHVMVGQSNMPMSASAVALVISAALGVWLLASAKK